MSPGGFPELLESIQQRINALGLLPDGNSTLSSNNNNNSNDLLNSSNATAQKLRAAVENSKNNNSNKSLAATALQVASLLELTTQRLAEKKNSSNDENRSANSPTANSPKKQNLSSSLTSSPITSAPLSSPVVSLIPKSDSDLSSTLDNQDSIVYLEKLLAHYDGGLREIAAHKSRIALRRSKMNELKKTCENTIKSEEEQEERESVEKMLVNVEQMITARSFKDAAFLYVICSRKASEKLKKSDVRFAQLKKKIPEDILKKAEENAASSSMSSPSNSMNVANGRNNSSSNNINDDDDDQQHQPDDEGTDSDMDDLLAELDD